MKETIELLFSSPPWIKSIILIFTLFILFGPIIRTVISLIFHLFVWAIGSACTFIFEFVILTILALIVPTGVENRSVRIRFIERIENIMTIILEKISNIRLGIRLEQINTNNYKGIKLRQRIQFIRKYKKIVWFLLFIVPIILYTFPHSEFAEKFNSVDERFLTGKLYKKMLDFESEINNTKIASINVEKQDDNEFKTLYLKEGISGGNVRNKPDSNASVVHIVSPGESLTFLNEQQKLNETNWLKVKVNENTIGWISSKIVK